MRIIAGVCLVVGFSFLGVAEAAGIEVGIFEQEVRTLFTSRDGLPSDRVLAVEVARNGDVYAATDAGLVVRDGASWKRVDGLAGVAVWALASFGDAGVVALAAEDAQGVAQHGRLCEVVEGHVKRSVNLPESLRVPLIAGGLTVMQSPVVSAEDDLYEVDLDSGQTKPLRLNWKGVRQIDGACGTLHVASEDGLAALVPEGWIGIHPRAGEQGWLIKDARGVACGNGTLWFAAPQGAGSSDSGGAWTLYTGREGLPYNDFTIAAAGEKGVIWFGTHYGAIRFDGVHWSYRQGLRWLPDNDVRDIAVTAEGHAYVATAKGLSLIERRPMTLAEKAKYYENQIDKYHRRTPYEFVLEVGLKNAGDPDSYVQGDSDNDGLWTSMYGAGECFAYAATKDPKAKERATKAFHAMKFLQDVTQGGEHSAPKGFVARTVLPTDGPNPNDGRLENDIKEQKEGDKLWKAYEPRWPTSADGKWYWKSDTSSDELDGHFFLYAQYYDLVCETEAEKSEAREQVRAVIDNIVEHNFNMVDHSGTPTRWARYSPEELNFEINWFSNRGLNSLSMISYLRVAEHVTGDARYAEVARQLIEKHGYAQNIMFAKTQTGAGTGNQSDDEMGFMSFYNLMKYERDADLRGRFAIAWWGYWRIEKPEMNPFFNFAFASQCTDAVFVDAWDTVRIAPSAGWLEDSVETLERFPLDRIDWGHDNTKRIDIVKFPEWAAYFDDSGYNRRGWRVNGKVVPVDEQYFNHWNHNLWELKTGGRGNGMGDGAVFLLPYYMGLYHGFIVEKG